MKPRRCLLLLVLLLPGPALRAEPLGLPPSPEAVAEADGHDRRGKVLYGKGELEDALAEFRAAHALDPRPAFLFNAGKALERLGRLPEAYEAYEGYLYTARGADEREAAAGVLAGLCVDVGRGLLRVTSTPPGARLAIDGRPFPVPADTRLCLPPGRHELSAAREGFEPARRSIEVPARGTGEVALVLARPFGHGTVRVLSEVLPATVLLDGVPVGAAPLDVAVPAGGPHELTVDAGEGWLPWRHTVQVREGHAISVRALPDLRPAVAAPDPAADGREGAGAGDPGAAGVGAPFNWGWVTLGTAAALAVTGGVLYGLAYDRVLTADGLDPAAPDYDDRFDSLSAEGQRLQIGAFVSWGLAAVTGLSTALVWVESPAAPAHARSPRPPFVGLTLGGTF